MPDFPNTDFEGGLSPAQFCQRVSIGRTRFYELIATGQIKARKNGRLTIVPVSEARRWFASLPEIASAA